MKYKKPNIEIMEAESFLLASSDIGGPGATDIGAPTISNGCKSIWDEVDTYNNIKEEQDYEDWI